MTQGVSLPTGLKLPEYDFQRAETCKGGLNQVQTDKCGKIDPVWIVKMTQEQAGQNEDARKDSDLVINFHGFVPF